MHSVDLQPRVKGKMSVRSVEGVISALRRSRVAAPLTAIDAHALKLVQGSHSPALDRAAVLFSHLGRGGLVWFGLAPVIGAGRRRLARREGTAVSAQRRSGLADSKALSG